MSMGQKIWMGLAWLYTLLISLWFILHQGYGDQIWGLALLNAFVPHFFVPLMGLLPLSYFYRRPLFWGGLVMPALLFIWLYGRLFLPIWPTQPAGTKPISVMTFNIWGGSQSAETAQVLRNNGLPDIVALQELTPVMAEVLIATVGADYPYHLWQVADQNRGMGILSRYPLTDLGTLSPNDPAWQIQRVRVATKSGQFIVYNCHPHSSNILVYWEMGQPIAAHVQADFATRRELIQRLLADIALQSDPVIVMGDFNSTDQSDVYALLANALYDAHRVAGWGLGHTFPAYSGSFHGLPIWSRQMRLDMIFYRPPFVALQSQVSSTFGESDHLPVVVKLAWSRKE